MFFILFLFGGLNLDPMQFYEVEAKGFVTDRSHPKFPGDISKYPCKVKIRWNTHLKIAEITWNTGTEKEPNWDRFILENGFLKQIQDDSKTQMANSFGDLAPSTHSLIYPSLKFFIQNSAQQNTGILENHLPFFICHNDLWTVQNDSLSRNGFSQVHGNYKETIHFHKNGEAWTTKIERDQSLILELNFNSPVKVGGMAFHPVDAESNDNKIIPQDIAWQTIGNGLHLANFKRLNSRTWVVEYAEYLVVLEGVYNSENVKILIESIKSRWAKPVKFFAFSHLHGQYIGGLREWIQEGATIIAPPSTKSLLDKISQANFSFQPDRQSLNPKDLLFEAVAEKKILRDKHQELILINVESEHTKDYLVFYFPQQKVLGTGDLMFWRPEKPLRGRSLKLVETIKEKKIMAETFVTTWPLEGYGIKNTVSRAQLFEAYDLAKSQD